MDTLAKLLEIQGQTVALALKNGLRIDGCKVVALPTRLSEKFWVFTDDQDFVVSAADVVEIWELVPSR